MSTEEVTLHDQEFSLLDQNVTSELIVSASYNQGFFPFMQTQISIISCAKYLSVTNVVLEREKLKI